MTGKFDGQYVSFVAHYSGPASGSVTVTASSMGETVYSIPTGTDSVSATYNGHTATGSGAVLKGQTLTVSLDFGTSSLPPPPPLSSGNLSLYDWLPMALAGFGAVLVVGGRRFD